jgi:hypothetical protein
MRRRSPEVAGLALGESASMRACVRGGADGCSGVGERFVALGRQACSGSAGSGAGGRLYSTAGGLVRGAASGAGDCVVSRRNALPRGVASNRSAASPRWGIRSVFRGIASAPALSRSGDRDGKAARGRPSSCVLARCAAAARPSCALSGVETAIIAAATRAAAPPARRPVPRRRIVGAGPRATATVSAAMQPRQSPAPRDRETVLDGAHSFAGQGCRQSDDFFTNTPIAPVLAMRSDAIYPTLGGSASSCVGCGSPEQRGKPPAPRNPARPGSRSALTQGSTFARAR